MSFDTFSLFVLLTMRQATAVPCSCHHDILPDLYDQNIRAKSSRPETSAIRSRAVLVGLVCFSRSLVIGTELCLTLYWTVRHVSLSLSTLHFVSYNKQSWDLTVKIVLSLSPWLSHLQSLLRGSLSSILLNIPAECAD